MRFLSLLFLRSLISVPLVLAAVRASQVGQRTLTFFDASRQRSLVTEIWYPTADYSSSRDTNTPTAILRSPTVRDGGLDLNKHATILLSHGTGGNRLTLEWLAFRLAEAGQVVVAVDHSGNTYDTVQPEFFLRVWERPQDLSFVLNELLRDPAYREIIDRERIGALGFSLGGYSVLTLAGAAMDLDALYRFADTEEGKKENTIHELPGLLHYMQEAATRERLTALFHRAPPLRDARIKAVVALAPAIGQSFMNAQQCVQVTAPTLIIVGQADTVAPMQTNARHYHHLIAHSRLVVLPGEVGHYIFLNEARDELRVQLPVLFKDPPSVSRSEIHRIVTHLTLDFFREHLAPTAPMRPTL